LIKHDDSKIMWVTCPDCGSKIGIIVSVGKAGETVPESTDVAIDQQPPEGIEKRLKATGIDTSLLNIEEGEEQIIVSPKKFLGDLWGPINDAIRSIGGAWIREGRDSRWEIKKEPAGDQ
jgi:hypothetical protein